MRTIAVLTSGGDAPGMNAAIRGVTRAALAAGVEVMGVQRGYAGLLDGDFTPLTARSVGGHLEHAGTFLGSARAPAFREPAARARTVATLRQAGVDGLVIVGGNGTQVGAHALHELGVAVVGVASTIDNDVFGVDRSLGFDSALNVVVEAMDRLRATSSSHRRGVLLEVMGRDTGHLALAAGFAGGAEAIVVPEQPVSAAQVMAAVDAAYARGKSHALVVVSEGVPGGAAALAEHGARQQATDAASEHGFALRVTTLGHVQRGGTPTALDRTLGHESGARAVGALLAGHSGVLVGLRRGVVDTQPLADVAGRRRPLDEELLRLATVLAQ